MKPKIDSITFARHGITAAAIAILSISLVEAQTNIAPVISTNQNTATPEIREVKGQRYDVSKPPFISVTIPACAALVNSRDIHYNPDAPKPCQLKLQIPAVYHFSKPVIMTINNFPYSPSCFQNGDWQTKMERPTETHIVGNNDTLQKIAAKNGVDYNALLAANAMSATTKLKPGQRLFIPPYPAIETGLVTKEPIALRLFPLFPAQTNFDATGAMGVIPAKPIFDYGTPVK